MPTASKQVGANRGLHAAVFFENGHQDIPSTLHFRWWWRSSALFGRHQAIIIGMETALPLHGERSGLGTVPSKLIIDLNPLFALNELRLQRIDLTRSIRFFAASSCF